MRFWKAVPLLALAAALLLSQVPGVARADAPARERPEVAAPAAEPSTPAVVAGTVAEARDYERREAAAPEVQEFEGGHVVVVGAGFLLLVLLIVLIVAIAD